MRSQSTSHFLGKTIRRAYLSRSRRRCSSSIAAAAAVAVGAAAATATLQLLLPLGHRRWEPRGPPNIRTDAALRPLAFAPIVRALLRLRILLTVNFGGGDSHGDSTVLDDAAAAAAASAATTAFCRLGWSECLSGGGVTGRGHRALLCLEGGTEEGSSAGSQQETEKESWTTGH